MQVIKTYKYKLKLSKVQEESVREWIHTCRAVYNLALDTKIYAYKSNKKNLSCYDLQKQVTDLKKDYEWIKAVPSQSLQDVIERMDGAYKKFFSGGGFPRFARKDRYHSITFKSVKVDGGYRVALPKLGTVKFFGTRLPEGELKQAIITKEINGHFISITAKKEVNDIKLKEFHSENQVIGIDVGVSFFYVTSDGEYVDNPRFLKTQQKQMRILQRALARKKKNSTNYRDMQKRIAKLHNKVRCQRLDFLHKTANNILAYDFIAAEKLQLKNMTKSAKGTIEEPGTNVKQKSGLNRSMLDLGIGIFFDIIRYKAKYQGKMFVQVPPQNTSNTCAICGYSHKDNRKTQSEFVCLKCGHSENADFNASENIKGKGIPFFRQREALACA
jgi:putative transposase